MNRIGEVPDDLIGALPFAEVLNREEKNRLLEHSTEVRYPAGKLLVESGALCEHVYVVLDGLIRIYKLSEEGREITYYRVGNGETCLFSMGCMLEHQPFDAVAQIEKDSRLLAVPGYLFEDLMNANPSFRNYIIRRLLVTITDLMILTEEVTFHSMNRRLSAFLLEESRLQGGDTLTITHEVISQELGTAREVVSRMLKEFEKKDLLALSRGKVRLKDVEGLEDLL
ncbi:MAG: Crp/Fnr family transcriptional regulator [Bacillota bacterium]|nr:Crp/Fnr family transcriptional regulator [Bacillota bacterium]MDW7678675.1 Crp/Fnr family transcriptional regulator [Bacillota bacterium]